MEGTQNEESEDLALIFILLFPFSHLQMFVQNLFIGTSPQADNQVRETESNGNHICDRCSHVTGRQYHGTSQRTWLALAYYPTFNYSYNNMGFPGGSEGKESACSVRDPGSLTGLGKSPGEGNAYPLQYSCLENSMDRGAWRATNHGLAKSQT